MRMLVLLVAFSVFVAITVSKLFMLQVLEHSHYAELASKLHTLVESTPARRGAIYDRNLNLLAYTLPAVRVFADPQMMENPDSVAGIIARIAGLDYFKLRRKLGRQGTRYVVIDNALEMELARKLESLNLKGIYFEPSGKRVRTTGDVALNIVGRYSHDGRGLTSIEHTLDKVLKGKPGRRRFLRDARGAIRPCVGGVVTQPAPGNSVVLTIDVDLQRIAEAALDRAVRENKAKGGAVVVVDPRSGDVLCLASNPRQDNFPVTRIFEPGSAFKICAIAAALELGRVSPETEFDTNGGVLPVAGGQIRDVHPKPHLKLAEAVKVSSNVVTALVARIVGVRYLYKYIRDFGFGSKTGLPLEGESRGILREPSMWSKRSLESIAIGQEIGTTAIQLAMAYAAIANGGLLLRPHLIRCIIDQDGQILQASRRQVIRRVISARTARILTDLLEGVVEEGTGVLAAIDGVPVAGKTGTGQKALGGGYAPGKYYSVFAGFLPSRDPRYVCVVVIDEPSAESHYGGIVCAPVFRQVMEEFLRRRTDCIPSICLETVRGAGDLRKKEKAAPASFESGSGAELTACSVPCLIGMTLRESTRILAAMGIRWRASGSGKVVKQIPEPGAELSEDLVCKLILKR